VSDGTRQRHAAIGTYDDGLGVTEQRAARGCPLGVEQRGPVVHL
jgi:hypothetical protein